MPNNLSFGEDVTFLQDSKNDYYLDGNGNIYKSVMKPYDRILNYIDYNGNPVYVDKKIIETASIIQYETWHGSVILDKTTCGFSYFNNGLIDEGETPLFTDSIIPKRSDVLNSDFVEIGQLTSASCNTFLNGNEIIAEKHVAGVGKLQYAYIDVNGSWKTELRATNLSSLTNQKFGFDQTIDLNRDVINYGGSQRNLDNYHQTTFDRNWIENNESKIINFLNGHTFDFDIAHEFLQYIYVEDTGNESSKLVFGFETDDALLPGETLVLDPTYTGSSSGGDAAVSTSVAADPACSTIYSSPQGSIIAFIGRSSVSAVCNVAWVNFDVSSIPDGVEVDSASIEYDVTVSTNGRNCDFKHYDATAANNQATYSAGNTDTGDVVDILQNTSDCVGTSTNTVSTFNTGGYQALFESDINGDDEISILISQTDRTRDTSEHQQTFANVELTINYGIPPSPDRVDDLINAGQTFGSVDLSWTQPELNGGNLTGYQINYTTPHGQPNTIITNNTQSSTTSTTIGGLSLSTDYSFRIGVWTESSNMTGNILNVTTTGNFTIGTAVFNQTNTQVLPITFEEQSINSTAKFLNVTYANTFTLACDFHYKFANTNQTYDSLTGTAVSTTLDETSFIFTDFNNEIIDVYCWDTITNTDADYLLIQNDFPLLQQIASFRAGDYGTDGKIGVFDFITLAVVIFSMIGLNRVNESVGAVFNIALLGALAYFEIIELPTIIFGIIAVVLVFAVTSTRKT